MKIANSDINLSSQHNRVEQHQRREQLTVWRDGEKPTEIKAPQTEASIRTLATSLAEDASALQISQEGHSLQPTKAIIPIDRQDEPELTALDNLKISMLKLLVEYMTGKKIDLIEPGEIQASDLNITEQPAAPEQAAPASTERTGFGLVYDYYESHYEGEFSSFSATANIQTQDGQQINVQIDLNMSREWFTEQSLNIRAGDALKDPLVLNFNGNAAELTETKFSFDLDTDGHEEQISFVGPGSGFLALDKNSDNVINNGSELFGPTTNRGFNELATYDLDGNNWIDENDDIYSQLRIWSKDATGNDRLMALGQRNIGAIYLGHIKTPFQINNQNNEQLGQTRSSGLFLNENGSAGTVQQLDLVV